MNLSTVKNEFIRYCFFCKSENLWVISLSSNKLVLSKKPSFRALLESVADARSLIKNVGSTIELVKNKYPRTTMNVLYLEDKEFSQSKFISFSDYKELALSFELYELTLSPGESSVYKQIFLPNEI
jgi:hypothetical protein